MTLKEIMKLNNFVMVGNTINEEKYAYKIKNELIANNYNVAAVYKELASINDVPFEIDVIDLCINATLGLKFLKENTKPFKVIVIQPGAESEELINYLNENNFEYIEGCLLLGLKLYRKE